MIDFEVSSISNDNQLAFIENSLLDLKDFVCKIENFKIKNSNFILSESILNRQVFKEISFLSISNSVLNSVQTDLFKSSFYQLKAADFELLNFGEFIQANKNNEWFKYLNSNVSVDLTNENDIKKNINNLFELTLTDYGISFLNAAIPPFVWRFRDVTEKVACNGNDNVTEIYRINERITVNFSFILKE